MPQPSGKTARSQRERAPLRGVGATARAPKASQLERLIEALVELAGQQGYQAVSISQISSRAGVSSATFYEYFADKEACMLAAYRTVCERTLRRVEEPLAAGGDWSQAARGAFGELLASLQEDPDGARVMFVEALTGGQRVYHELSAVLDSLQQTGETLLGGVAPPATTLDLPAMALIGAVRAVVTRHLRTFSEDRLADVTDDLLTWMGAYGVPAAQGRWSVGPEALLGGPTPTTDLRPQDGTPPELDRLPRGRHGLPASVVARSQRTRVVVATGWVAMEKGYANMTVADIVAVAGVGKDAFYRHFRDKEEAFLEALQYGTHFVLDLLVQAHFSVERWPERVWRTLRALLELIAANPMLAHLRLVASYTAGSAAIRRTEDFTRFFTMFIEEGYSQRKQARELPRLCSQAISGAIFELIQREVADGRGADLPRRLPQLTYIALAPFLGPSEAIAAVTEMSATLEVN
jgi:AcrR family transcriptional regulator